MVYMLPYIAYMDPMGLILTLAFDLPLKYGNKIGFISQD